MVHVPLTYAGEIARAPSLYRYVNNLQNSSVHVVFFFLPFTIMTQMPFFCRRNCQEAALLQEQLVCCCQKKNTRKRYCHLIAGIDNKQLVLVSWFVLLP